MRILPTLALLALALFTRPAPAQNAPAQDAPTESAPKPGVLTPLPPGQVPPGFEAPTREPPTREPRTRTPGQRVYPEPFPQEVVDRSLDSAWSTPGTELRLAMLAEVARRAVPTRDCVVIVPDTASYVAALAAWRPGEVFPVLIDDGTPRARADIARFNRAFLPKQVVRWQTPGGEDLPAEDVPLACLSAFAGVWDLPLEEEDFIAAAKAADARVGSRRVIGAVVFNPGDPAWTGGLALSLARYQPMLAVPEQGKPNEQMPYDQTSSLVTLLHSLLDQTGLDWRELGDDVDAITIAMNMPVRCSAPDGTARATTDRIGRLDDDTATTSTRWAWTGQIIGSAPRSAYAAMCSLFLQPERGWFFDTYPNEAPWNAYTLAQAAERLAQSPHTRLQNTVDAPEPPTRLSWHGRVSETLDAGLIWINSKGLVRTFELRSTELPVGDLPILTVPAAVHMVHSFAAQQPSSSDTVAGTWLDRGAFAMIGSVDEPGLSGFQPSPIVAQRLAAGMPWAVAARYPIAQCWKITVMGDPLFALGTWRPRTPGAPPALSDTKDLDEALREALAAQRFGEGVEILALLGRDADAVRLARSAASQRPESLTATLASAAAMPLFRGGYRDEFLDMLRRVPANARTKEQVDALWLAARRELLSGDADWLVALRENLRPTQIIADMTDLAAEYERVMGTGAARDLVIEQRDTTTLPHIKKRLEDLARRYGG